VKRKNAIFISFFAGLLGLFLIIDYVNQIKEDYAIDSNLKNILIAKKYIPPYSIVTKEMVEISQIPAKYLPPKVITKVKELYYNKKPHYVNLVPILKNEPILLSKLTILGENTGLAVVVEKGKRAISIPIENSSLSELILPGNKVDLIATFEDKSVYLLQNLLVLAVGKNILGNNSKKEEKSILNDLDSDSENNITLAVLPEEALKIAYTKDKCVFHIVIRSSIDNDKLKINPITHNNLFYPASSKKDKIKIYKGIVSEEKVIQ